MDDPDRHGAHRWARPDVPKAFTTTPSCCPTRASFLSGGFLAQHTGVLTNDEPNGGPRTFNAFLSLPLALQRAGYRTALVGK